jgi:cyclopropane fatty-acyl-phospholipid synthase-like methyltransferase
MDLGFDALPLAGGTDETFKQEIAAYYDATQVLYSNVWSPTGVHYGFWEPDTATHQQSIRNMDRTVAARLGLDRGMRVLDAGCGIGGTSLFFAETYGADVLGITLSTVQLEHARAGAAASAARVRPTFRIADYLATPFPSGSFDGVFAIESVCYAKDKCDFLREAFRVLRPGGRLVVADGFVGKPITGRYARHYRRFLEGLALDNLATVDGFEADMQRTGFVDVRRDDKHEQVRRSARRIWKLSVVGLAICTVGCRLGLLPDAWLGHGRAGVAQWPLFRSGAFTYCVFSATKP